METTNSGQPASRPVFLTVLCILTFIACGFSFIGMMINVFRGPSSPDDIETESAALLEVAGQLHDAGASMVGDLYEKMAHMLVYLNDSFYLMLTINFLTLLLGVGGTILMWRGRRNGFHAYVLYNIVGILAIYAAVPVNTVPSVLVITQVILSAVFIFMYSRNLRWLK